jgi:hypothetical protein
LDLLTHIFTQFETRVNCSAVNILHTFTSPLHKHKESVLTSRILATDLSQSHFYFYMTPSGHILIPFLPFPAAANSEDSTQFSSNYFSLFLQLLNSQFQFSNLISLATNRISIYNLGLDSIENAVFSCQVLLCYLATHCSIVHREHIYC